MCLTHFTGLIVDGLLCPHNENGKRYFLKVKTKEEFLREVETEVIDIEIVTVGPFQFLKSAFDNPNDFLMALLSKTKHKCLIIDELGKSELRNLGLHSAAKKLISYYQNNNMQHLILVVIESLFEEIVKRYDISKYKTLKKEDLEQIE